MKKIVCSLFIVFSLIACSNPQAGSDTQQAGENCDTDKGIECASGLTCVNGTCRLPCNTYKDCGKKQKCDNNFCIDDPKGECWPGWAGGSCNECDNKYFGKDCTACPICEHGKCLDGLDGTGKCQCAEGWAGELCDECDANYFGANCQKCPECGEHGTCADGLTGDGRCLCANGWSGESCDSCQSGYFGADCTACPSCGGHGRCLDGREGDGSCECNGNWTGDSCTECQDNFFGEDCGSACPECGEHGSCADGATGSGLCECDKGWAGTNCDYELKKIGLACDADTECQSGLVCDEYTQKCQKACKSVTDCNEGQSCQDDGHCNNCPEGFKGQNCDQCLTDRYGADCKPCKCQHGICDSGITGSGLCEPGSCDIGWKGESYCSECASGYWGTECKNKCECDAANTLRCDEGLEGTGCICRSNWDGDKCDKCVVGTKGTMQDKVGRTYPTVCINGQFWMAKNMDYATGTLGTDYYYPNGNADNRSTYGLLYPWSTAITICPSGWRLPSRSEFNDLLTYVEKYKNSDSTLLALIAKSDAWTIYKNQGGDDFGFGGLPAGLYYSGSYYNFGFSGYWWSSTEFTSSNAYYLYLGRGNAYVDNYDKTYGSSVRCLRDSN